MTITVGFDEHKLGLKHDIFLQQQETEDDIVDVDATRRGNAIDSWGDWLNICRAPLSARPHDEE